MRERLRKEFEAELARLRDLCAALEHKLVVKEQCVAEDGRAVTGKRDPSPGSCWQ